MIKSIDCWYDRSLQLWTAIYKDEFGVQVGKAGYGMSKLESKCDLQYQNN